MEGIGACRKRLGLYPTGHPRLVEAMESLRASLAKHTEETGLPFKLNSVDPARPEATRSAPLTADEIEAGPLRLTLRKLRVSALTIDASASADELWRLCSFLAQDTTRPDKIQTAQTEPESSEHVRFSMFSVGDSADDLTAKPVARIGPPGVARTRSIDGAVKNLPHHLQEAVREAISNRSLLGRLSLACDSLQAQLGPEAEGAGGRVDILEAMLQTAFEESLRSTGSKLDSGHVERIVEATTNFLEEKVRRPQGDLVSESTDGSLAQVIDAQKHKLEFLFKKCATGKTRSANVSEPARPAEPRVDAAPEAAATPIPSLASPPDPATLLPPGMPSTRFSPAEEQEVLRDTTPHGNYCRVLFELLARNGTVTKQRGCWPQLVEAFVTKSPSPGHLETVLNDALERLRSPASPELEEFLGDVLTQIQQPALIGKALDEFVVRFPGFSSSSALLRRIEEKDPKLGFALCQWIHKKGKSELRSLAESRLLHRAETIEGLLRLVIEAQECFLQPRVLKASLSKHKSDQIFECFKKYFDNAKELEAGRLLSGLTKGIKGVEEILCAAMESRNSSLRSLAITSLWKAGSPGGFRVVQEIIRKNNMLRTPNMGEVEAAMDALLRLEGVDAEDLRREISKKRSFFRHIYRKELRKALEAASEKRKEGSSA